MNSLAPEEDVFDLSMMTTSRSWVLDDNDCSFDDDDVEDYGCDGVDDDGNGNGNGDGDDDDDGDDDGDDDDYDDDDDDDDGHTSHRR